MGQYGIDDEFPKISKTESLILDMLIANGEMFGLEMVKESEGRLKRGTVYVTLQRMSEKGLVDSWEEERPAPEIGIPRRKFIVTGLGHKVFNAQQIAVAYLSGLAWQEVG